MKVRWRDFEFEIESKQDVQLLLDIVAAVEGSEDKRGLDALFGCGDCTPKKNLTGISDPSAAHED